MRRRSGFAAGTWPACVKAFRVAGWAVLLACLAGCIGSARRSSSGGGGSEGDCSTSPFPGLAFKAPTNMLQHPADSSRWFVAERAGRVQVVDSATPCTVSGYGDISAQVDTNGEGGLLGMAFHPDYPDTPEVFLSYTVTSSPLRSIVSRFTESGGVLDEGTEDPILTLEQPQSNHNGAPIAFGPDGYLYIGFGDGGGGGDEHGTIGNGQDLTALLGKLLRIDVDGGAPYAIPPSNPFATPTLGEQPEIYAYGLRNPWRLSFDRNTGDLWLADVGQGSWEEVDRVTAGANLGWRVMEGAHCYNPSTGCDMTGKVLPVAEYSHSVGCSISGGYVYRGSKFPALFGRYVYGDFCSGRIWGVPSSGGAPVQVADTNLSIVGFAEGADGELYVLDIASGRIYRLVPDS